MIRLTTVLLAVSSYSSFSTAVFINPALTLTNAVGTTTDRQLSVGMGSLDITYRELAKRRAENIARLHVYAGTGTFPRNTDFPGQLVPYFVDRLGTACAVAHLMRLDGEDHLVRSIASSTNHVRIESVHNGPLLEWIRDSGLTKGECALIQPSYAAIEYYRPDPAWQDEIVRLKKHFAEVEQTLLNQTQRSLREALIAKLDAQLAANPNDPALAIDALSESLRSVESNVRIAAAHALAQQTTIRQSARLEALEPNLSATDLETRFWSAVAIQRIGAASPRGNAELYSRILPVFLDAAQSSIDGLRLAALVQLANTAPMTMGTNKQFRIMPEIRQTVIQACEDEDSKVRQFATSVLKSWRWQRVVYESQRIRRQYLAGSADLEALATETFAIGRKFAEQPDSIRSVVKLSSIYDTVSYLYMLPATTETPLPVAESSREAKQLVDDFFKIAYEQYRNKTQSPWPFWDIVSVESDQQGLYYVVVVERKDMNPSPKLIYLVPRSSMLSWANRQPYDWFEREALPVSDARNGTQRVAFHANEEANVVFGTLARNDKLAFATACDIFAYFLTELVLDRAVEESADALVWTGRFARSRANNPRFFGEGVGFGMSSGGGWDFYRLSFRCERATGQLTFSADPIEYPIAQLPPSELTPAWVEREYKVMGWKSLNSLDFLGDVLLPSEYHEAIEAFKYDAGKTRSMLEDRHNAERFLPLPDLVMGLLYERAGDRESAVRSMQRAADESSRHDPTTLAEVARWELGVGLHDDARKHAESAVALWPEHPMANQVLERLDQISIGTEE